MAKKVKRKGSEEKGTEMVSNASEKKKSEQNKGRKPGFLDRTLFSAIPKQNVVAAILASVLLWYSVEDPNDKLHYKAALFDLPKGWETDRKVPKEADLSMEQASPHTEAIELTVTNFYDTVLNASEDKYYMVIFYDPWSNDYKTEGSMIDQLARKVKSSQLLQKGQAEVGVVNLGIHEYLLQLHGKELLTLVGEAENPVSAPSAIIQWVFTG